MTQETPTQSFEDACTVYVDHLNRRVIAAGRGDDTDHLAVDPSATFWLGRLASEDEVANNVLGDRAERLDPCAIGIRLRPSQRGPWHFQVTVAARAWIRDTPTAAADPARPWRGTDRAVVTVDVDFDAAASPSSIQGAAVIADALTRLGAAGLTAEVRVSVEERDDAPELLIEFVNTSPEKHPQLKDTHLYETSMTVAGLGTTAFVLDALPDSFRYDRKVPAFGVNVGVVVEDAANGHRFRTTDTSDVQTSRSTYWNSSEPEPDLTFQTLATDPLPQLRALVAALHGWGEVHWSENSLEANASRHHWTGEMVAEAHRGRAEFLAEANRLADGLALLETDDELLTSFRLMNRAIGYAAQFKSYDGWRSFQIGFLLGALRFLREPHAESDIVDTVWFATGGGKTETYLGLLVTAAFHDRLTGKASGVTAWSRFPLRLLSLQQTQRFADALAGAERVRQEERIPGDPFSLGFFVGKGGTPNKVVKDATADGQDPDPDSAGMPDTYQVLLKCPFCHQPSIEMRFDRRIWSLTHECTNDDCPWTERALPVYIVDQEIYRFLPTVVLGTLDKAASIGLQAAMRGLVGPPLGRCTVPGHGHTYAPRFKTPNGCLVPDCPGGPAGRLAQARERYAPSLRLQDELHLLRDSLGAVDAHYESLLDHLQGELHAPRAKIVASSATLNGHDRQVATLYQRQGRVFPVQGPTVTDSFWSRSTDSDLRRFVAVAPRGVTLEHVSDRTLDVLQETIRELVDDPGGVCAHLDIDPGYADALISMYGTDVVYGSTLYDVEAAERSLASNTTVGDIKSEQLTGATDFDSVRDILDRLENPPDEFADRIHVVAASSMLSHGVDVARLNVMVMLGLPLGTAEFIQTTARVGRTHPGLVYVLHKIGRERDAQTFRLFDKYVTHGDRFVEPIPVTRRSRRVLRLTLPGIMEGRRLALMEPSAPGQRLTTIDRLRDYFRDAGITAASQTADIAAALGFDDTTDETLLHEIRDWMATYFVNLGDPATSAKWPSDLGQTRPMISLRDVEPSAPIHD